MESLRHRRLSRRVERVRYTSSGSNLVIEVLDDSVIHFELSATGVGPDTNRPLYATPMVSKTDYPGPSRFSDNHLGVSREPDTWLI